MVIENDTPMSSSPVVKYLPLEPPYGRRRAPSASLCASHPFLRASLGGTRQADFRSAVTTREVIPAMLANVDREQVRLHAVALPLEFAPLLELGDRVST